tara:strand:+ start:3743 stop:4225 length:483 start_codon:yes stop_codon:yes gene_type:complete
MPYIFKPETIIKKFWERVDKKEDNDCWNWTGAKVECGYGKFSIKGKTQTAHRYSYFLHHGKMPDDLCLHSCDNRLCVNPKHLRNGTHTDNMRDASERHRFNHHGEHNTKAKLTETDVINIRKEFVRISERNSNCAELAEKYSVSISAIGRIISRVSWSHI